MKVPYLVFLFLLAGLYTCQTKNNSEIDNQKDDQFKISNPQTLSLLGKPLSSPTPSDELTARWLEKKDAYDQDSLNIENIIWYGRFTAYMGDYVSAINIYTTGMMDHPDEPRLYRHRGHRYITLRKFDRAIADFTIASDLIKGTANQVEPDGMPNAQNIPVSTLHGNIFYHKGLAYYLKGDMPNALAAYQLCLETSERPDNVVSAVHWLYMILNRMNQKTEADQFLELIDSDMEIIENHSYHKLCLFYKGFLEEESLIDPEDSSSANDAIKYGVANWNVMLGDRDRGYNQLLSIVKQNGWASFGYIAAEADLARGVN